METLRNIFSSMSCMSARATKDVVPMKEDSVKNQASNTKMSINNRDINPDTIEQRDERSPSTELFTRSKEIDERLSELKKNLSKIKINKHKKRQIEIEIKSLQAEKHKLGNQFILNGYKSEDLKGVNTPTSRDVQLLHLLKVEEESLDISQDSKQKIAEIKSKQKNMVINNNKFFNKRFADIRVKDNSKLNLALSGAAGFLLDIPMMWMGDKDVEILANGVTDMAVAQIGENFNNAYIISGEIRAVLATRDVETIKKFINTKLEEYPENTHEQLNLALKALNKLG